MRAKKFRWAALPLLCLSLWGAGCAENLDPATPEGAMHRLRDAVMQKDAAALLAASSQATHQSLAQLHTRLAEQRTAIDEKYPVDERAGARGAFPTGLLDATDSAALFAALVAPKVEALQTSPGLAYGLTAMGRPTITDQRASVPTQSGETVEFVLEDGAWRTTVFERALEQNLNRVRLNEQTLAENLKVFDELKRRAAATAASTAASAP
jgi:hypothetical protein